MAMNFTEDMAERYATSAMPVISASEIYKRTSGRAYPMPKNLRTREGKPITPRRKPSLAMQTVAADMRDGFINSVNNGNEIQILNPSTGRWTSIDPNTVSQELLTTGQFRIRKPGREGVTIGQKVYGKTVDLRSMQQYSGQARTRQVLDLADYPELQTILGISKGTIRNRDAWQGKEPELLNWMRANGIGKLVLPDVKSRGGSTVLVDPDLVDGFGN
jgi:hypothetical protein